MEPKSIHTYFEPKHTDIYNYDVDLQVTDFPDSPDSTWLYYFAITVRFVDDNEDEWAHGGIQWASAFSDNANKGVNWGGESNWAGYGGIGVNNTPFTWKLETWYRFRVWRVDKDSDGFRHWVFAVMDYSTNQERQFKTIKTKSEWIRSADVFTETGYGVQCDTPTARAEWRNPCFQTPAGLFSPNIGIANYNGTCTGIHNTNQRLITKEPQPHWCHETNCERTVQPDQQLW